MTDKQLELFVKTAKYKSFNEAANELFISRPSLNYAITSLEEELGVNLFLRSNQGIELTTEGVKILKDVDKILEIISKWKTNSKNKISLYAVGVVLNFIIPQIIHMLSNEYPNIRISIHDIVSSDLINKSSYTVADETIIFDVFDEDKKKEMISKAAKNHWNYQIIRRGYAKVLINSNNPLAKNESVSLEMLVNNCVATTTLPVESQVCANFWNAFPEDHLLVLPTDESRFQMISMDKRNITLATDIAIPNIKQVNSGLISTVDLIDFPLGYIFCIFYPENCNQEYMGKIFQKSQELLENR